MQHRPPPHLSLAVAVTLLLGTAAGCRDAGAALGASSADARANADTLLFALGARFGRAQPVPGYDESRAKVARAALVPSRLYNDPWLWTASGDDTRTFDVAGRTAGSGYLLGIREGVAPPLAPGEYRRSTQLHRLARNEYAWAVRDELAVGRLTPDQLAAALTALLAAIEGSDEPAARVAYRAALPQTSAALGRLFDLDSLALAPAPSGGARVTLVTTLHPRRIADEFPAFARYLERYATPFRFDVGVRDAQGLRWWTARKTGDRIAFDFRVHGGALAPLEGPPRRMPDRLRVRADLATRIRIFSIRIAELAGNVTLTRTHTDKSFTVRFRDEPDWHLPPLTERLIRTPLRRPFEGDGASLTYSARAAGGHTLLVRDYQVAVQESAILRWFGGLGNAVVGDFRKGAEEEYKRFIAELFDALRADAAALIR